jgi:glutaryl-CoA dehydrogenase
VLAVVAAGLPLRHTGRRLQFGKPIAGFQLVQDLLVRMRETVGWAREVLGGNGVLLEHHVGRAVTGESASV